MARTESKIKLGFYPTPPPVVRAVAPYLLAFQRNATLRLLDPCAGDGKALTLLASEMAKGHERQYGRYADFSVTTWAIEPQAHLAGQARDLVNHLLEASFFTTTLSSGESQDHGWQLCWLNPPYDTDNESGGTGKKTRQEISFLQRTTDKLCAQGILVFIIPQNILRRAARYLASYYEAFACYRFPDEVWRPPNLDYDISMYEQFHQIVLIARRRSQSVPPDPEDVRRIEGWSQMGTLLPPLPLEVNLELPRYHVPNAPHIDLRYFHKSSFDPDQAARTVGQFSSRTRRPAAGVWASEDYQSARFPDPRKTPLAIGRSLQKYKRGYLATFAAAGIADRYVLEGEDGRRVLVKGRTRKTTHYHKDDDGEVVVEKTTDRFESTLQCMDLDTGELLVVQTGSAASIPWGIEYESMTMSAFLKNYGASVMRQVMEQNAPRYRHHSQVPWAGAAFAKISHRPPLGKQIDTVLAQVHGFINRWRDGGMDDDELLTRIGEIAEMASGKTYMAIVTAFIGDLFVCGCVDMASKASKVLHLFPAVVLSPPIMARKWKREIEETLPGAKVVIVERFGPSRAQEDDDEEDEEEEEIPGGQMSNAADNYRAFDPEFTGTSLGTVGCVERVVARISRELAAWQRAYTTALAENRTPPLKPMHVLILTFSTAKLTPQWSPYYRLRVARSQDPETDLIQLRKDSRDQPFTIPCCPHCWKPLKDQRRVRGRLRIRDGYSERLLVREKLRAERVRLGKQWGQQINAMEERLQQHLSASEVYRALLAERQGFYDNRVPPDALYETIQLQIDVYLGQLPEYRRLLAEQTEADKRLETYRDQAALLAGQEAPQAWNEEETALVAALLSARHAYHAFLHDLLLTRQEYRDLIVALDQRFRVLQLACEERLATFVQQAKRDDEAYQALLADFETIRFGFVRQQHRLAQYEEDEPDIHALSVFLTEAELQGTKDHRVKRSCQECGEPLWQYVPKKIKGWQAYMALGALPARRTTLHSLPSVLSSRVLPALPIPTRDFSPACVRTTYKRRWPIADLIRKHYRKRFKLLIADETHEGADGTALDGARQSLANACTHMLALTGTASNGYASSLFRLLYLMLRLVRQQFQYEEKERWIDVYGKRQMMQKSRYEEPETGTGSDSKRKLNPGMPVYKEIAGFSPAGMGHMARSSTFTELKEVVPNLVGYQELVHVVKMGDTLRPAYKEFEETSTIELGKMLSTGDKSGLSAWFQAMLTYPNMPWRGWTCRSKSGVTFGTAPALPEDMVYPLERELIDYVQDQHLKGLPVLVFSENTGKYDVLPRLKTLLETKVRGRGGRKLKVDVLRSTTVKTIDREEWLNRRVKVGVDVLICNPKLVKVGLDLLHFPRIVYTSFPKSTSDLRQSARRSLRPGQTIDVEVVFLCYEGTMGLRLLHHMARKTQVSLMVEGNVDGNGLVALGAAEEEEEGDVIAQMARQVVNAMGHEGEDDAAREAEELQAMFRQVAVLERQQSQSIDEENDLAAAVVLAEIQRVPLRASTHMGDGELAPEPAEADTSVAVAPSSQEIPEDEIVTIIPISVTSDPWANPIIAQATADIWAAYRDRYVQPKRRGRRRN